MYPLNKEIKITILVSGKIKITILVSGMPKLSLFLLWDAAYNLVWIFNKVSTFHHRFKFKNANHKKGKKNTEKSTDLIIKIIIIIIPPYTATIITHLLSSSLLTTRCEVERVADIIIWISQKGNNPLGYKWKLT